LTPEIVQETVLPWLLNRECNKPEVAFRRTQVRNGHLQSAVRSQLVEVHGIALEQVTSHEARRLVVQVGEARVRTSRTRSQQNTPNELGRSSRATRRRPVDVVVTNRTGSRGVDYDHQLVAVR